ncbi:MAG: DUF599 domain-containing protein [Candidatus Thermoplasmatota archaeon]|nr:DUF599 domain-containing protein [Candidatus Thermoplasmatota archaeon]MBS3802581.1 DUF599 domain-containing protein [Candidatus Thermoplasmatota archaeon]
MLSSLLINIIGFAIFVLCILIYSIKLLHGIKKPGTAKRGLLNIYYSQWVKRMINQNETIIAVQTMRNLIMATTFLTSSMLVLLGLLLRIPSNGIDELIQFSATSTELIAQYKVLLFVVVLLFSIIMFLLSLRQMVRFSILIGIPVESIETITPEYVNAKREKKASATINAETLRKDVFLRAMNRFTFGIRSVFYAMTIILWFISVYAFIIGTISLTIFLIRFQDIKTPRLEETPI